MIVMNVIPPAASFPFSVIRVSSPLRISNDRRIWVRRSFPAKRWLLLIGNSANMIGVCRKDCGCRPQAEIDSGARSAMLRRLGFRSRFLELSREACEGAGRPPSCFMQGRETGSTSTSPSILSVSVTFAETCLGLFIHFQGLGGTRRLRPMSRRIHCFRQALRSVFWIQHV